MPLLHTLIPEQCLIYFQITLGVCFVRLMFLSFFTYIYIIDDDQELICIVREEIGAIDYGNFFGPIVRFARFKWKYIDADGSGVLSIILSALYRPSSAPVQCDYRKGESSSAKTSLGLDCWGDEQNSESCPVVLAVNNDSSVGSGCREDK
ncbi:hypothetical protein SLE2022_135320 [Rubroshorea leprosula]